MLSAFTRSRLLAIPEVRKWPEMERRIGGLREGDLPSWLWYPVVASRSVGGSPEDAWPGTAAIFCLLTSIALVDDILDEDPDGAHHDLGVGEAANLALAFQAAAHRVLDETVPSPELLVWAHRSLSHCALATALGQHLDASQKAEGGAEASYWRAVRAKTPPLFGTALFLGALLGGASPETAERLAEIATPLGEIVQIHDDVSDALAEPSSPDWRKPLANLVMLYAACAEHGDRQRFQALLERAAEEGALDAEPLREAQTILLRSGALNYCVYRLFDSHRRARKMIDGQPLANPEPMQELLEGYVEPVRRMLTSLGLDTTGFSIR